MSRKVVLLTFDYELFLGKRSGSVEKCMLEPTRLLLDMLGKHQKKAVFFIDTTYLFRLNEIRSVYPDAQKDFENIKNQVKNMFDRGHYVFHHLHPHWLDATYIPGTNEWDLSNKERFAFSNLAKEEREKIFTFSHAILYEIRNETTSTLPINGYRAGGLYLQPFEAIQPFFDQFQVQYDFSVHPGFTSQNPSYGFDYMQAPLKPFYRFADQPAQETPSGSYYEFPINHLRIPLLQKIIHSVYYRSRVKGNPLGQRIGDGKSSGNLIRAASASKFSATRETFSIEQLNDYKLRLYKKHLKKMGWLHIISHPKLLSALNFASFDKFLSSLSKDPEIIFDFQEMIPA